MSETNETATPSVRLSEYRKIRPIVKKVEKEMASSIGADSKGRRIARRSAAITALSMNRKIDELEGHALEDALTGLKNRRWLEQALESKMASSKRSGNPLFLIYIDFDDFKDYNTAYGHLVGDNVLKQVAKLSARDDEPIARIGGDEFGQLVNRDVTEQDIANMIKRYQEEIAEASSILNNVQVIRKDLNEDSIPRDIKITFGVAKFDTSEDGKSFVKRANEAAHYGKNKGKNMVTMGEVYQDKTIVFRNLKNG